MTDILPVNTGGGFGSDAMGAFGGALVGSIFGDAWGGNGFGNRGFNSGVGEGVSTTILNDGINAIQNSINGSSQNLYSGLCNLGYQTLDLSSRNALSTANGFNQVGRDMASASGAIVGAVNSASDRAADCCCATQKLIAQEGCATRELIQSINTQNIRDQLCDAKAKIGSLESNAFTVGAINQAVSTIIKHIPMPAA